MGWLSSLLVFIVPASGAATWLAFRLGDKLPIASRRFGRNIGMGYNYFKVVLKLLAPESSSPAEIIDLMRKTDQQSAAFTREVKESFMRAKFNAKESLPEELRQNPMNILRIQPDIPLENPTGKQYIQIIMPRILIFQGKITGSVLLDVAFRERKRIIERKKDKKAQSSFINP